MSTLRVLTYNMHKGLSALNQRLTVHALGRSLAALNLDVICLQEVQGAHSRRSRQHLSWPELPQADYLARELAYYSVYGQHAMHRFGHHGNAILSRLPLQRSSARDLTLHRFEQRGLVHAVLQAPGWGVPLHVLCLHLNLWHRHRQYQLQRVADYLRQQVPLDEPVLLAGDFNDWRQSLSAVLEAQGFHEAYHARHGTLALTFPARLPFLALDRMYVRGLKVSQATVLAGPPWPHLSDHLPLLVELSHI